MAGTQHTIRNNANKRQEKLGQGQQKGQVNQQHAQQSGKNNQAPGSQPPAKNPQQSG